jgi:hypothetical protein
MRNVLGPNSITGYCTNVHAGDSLGATMANLEAYAVDIKKNVCPDEPMGVGLWLAHNAAEQMIANNRIDEFKAWLVDRGLLAFTLNGFPYGNFHEAKVKHKVYEPDWSSEERLNYTINLSNILARILPEDVNEGSISTLPIGWRHTIQESHDKSFIAAQHLIKLTEHLERLEGETGKLIHIDIEPEPGCFFDTGQDVVDFFKNEILLIGNELLMHRYLRVCHDVCHSAVMFEPQLEVLDLYKNAGIEVGKVQISSAIHVPFDELDDHERLNAFRELKGFQEDRYLHQTHAQTAGSHFYDDLSDAIKEFDGAPPPAAAWRVHFHVPIFLERFGLLQTTQAEVLDLLAVVQEKTSCHHFEVETYAWGVLPPELRAENLSLGIADELLWLKEQAAKLQAAEQG